MFRTFRWFALTLSCFILGHAMYQVSLGLGLSTEAAGAIAWVSMGVTTFVVALQMIIDDN